MFRKNRGDLPYRNNVAGVLFRGNQFLLLQREDWKDNHWKFPQGGVNDGEGDEDALNGELVEEIGTDKFEIIGKAGVINSYDWDDYAVEKAGFRWRGQFQGVIG